MKSLLKKNYLFLFLFSYLFGIETTFCESIDSCNDENLFSNENNKVKESENISDNSKKVLILSGLILLISLGFLYYTGETFYDDMDVETVVEKATDIIKDVKISEKRTEAERKAFMKAFHVGLQIPSWW